VAVGDLHINSTVGLIRPTTNLDDGGTYNSSKGQRWLWRNWLDFWDEVQAVQKRTGKRTEIWTVFNGDLVDVNGRHIQTQNISQNDTDVQNMARDTIQPAIDRSDRVFVVRGTAAHVKSSASMEEKIAIDIKAEVDPQSEVMIRNPITNEMEKKNRHSWWELLLECEGVLFDIRHHGKLGYKQWTTANALNARAIEMVLHYKNKRCPDVAIQSHNHRYARSSNDMGIEVYALPAWQLATEFVKRIGNIFPADIGGAYFICDKGQYTPVIKRYEPERIRAWKAK